MVFFGGLFTAAAVLLIVYGAAGARTDRPAGAPAATPAAGSGDPAVSREDSTPPSV